MDRHRHLLAEAPAVREACYRDDGYIANMAGAITTFNEELAATVEQVRRFGAPLIKVAA
jgi:hypothetical protein